MKQSINKDTKLYGSFSTDPGNNGCKFFNHAFERHGIDGIYKSFYSDDISKTIQSVKHLNFSGFALSRPHKISVIPYLDGMDNISYEIGSVNTVLNIDGFLKGFNTDYFGVLDFFNHIKPSGEIIIIGRGGFGKSIQRVCEDMDLTHSIFSGRDINELKDKNNCTLINATPIEISITDKVIIDLRPHTEHGGMVAKFQAIHQFELYTKIKYIE